LKGSPEESESCSRLLQQSSPQPCPSLFFGGRGGRPLADLDASRSKASSCRLWFAASLPQFWCATCHEIIREKCEQDLNMNDVRHSTLLSMSSEIRSGEIFGLLCQNQSKWMTVTEIRDITGLSLSEYQEAIRSLKDHGYVETQNVSTGLFGSVKITDMGIRNCREASLRRHGSQ